MLGRWIFRRGLVLAFLLSAVAPAMAQTYQGAIRGQARDQGGVLPGADVTLVNEATGAERTSTTNDVGEYAFANVLPGTYSITVSLNGFKTEARKSIRIGTQQSVVEDFTLGVGAISEQVTVTAEAPLVERSSATVASTLDRSTLQALPIFGRNAFYSAISTPGVIQSGDPQFVRYQDQTNASYLSLGGGPRRGNSYLIEGVPITDFFNRPTIVPSIEAVEEVKVQTKTYEADMGHAAGGVFNTTARSGSNAFHGSALIVDKPGWATGQLYFAKIAGIPNPPQYYYNYAGSFGGPIVKDRTFFWASLDNYEQLSTRNNVLTLPTALERAGNFSQTRNAAGQLVVIYDPLTTRLNAAGQIVRDPFPGNVIPANRINPVSASMFQTVPLPSSGRSLNGVASLLDGPQYQQTLKVDQRWNGKWSTSGVYAHQQTREPGSAFFGDFGSNPADPAGLLLRTINFFALNNVFVPNNTTAIAVRYGFNRFYDSGNNAPAPFDVSTLGWPSSYVNALTMSAFPAVSLNGYGAAGAATTLGNTGLSNITHYTHSASVSVSKFAGHHTLKTGGEYRRIGADAMQYGTAAGSFTFTQGFTQASPTAASTSAGDAFASFLLGYPASGSVVQATPGHYLIDYFAGFAEDEYRVTPSLTLNYGLRYEYEPGVREADNHITVGFDRNALFPVQVAGLTLRGGLQYAGVNGNPTTQGSPLDGVAPRGGFAWSLGEKTVLRGGYGFYWAPNFYPSLGEAAIGSKGYTSTTTYLASTDGGLTPSGSIANPFPNGITPPQGNSLGLLTGAGGVIDFVDQDAKPGYVQQYSVDLQHELRGGNVVSLGYTGSRSARLGVGGTQDATVNINQLDPQYLALGSALLQLVPNPFYGNSAFGNLAASPTISRGQLLRPFPEFDNVLAHRVNEARARYNALLLQWNRRVDRNWGANVNYTYSRLDDNQFGEANTYSNRLGSAVNNYDLSAEYGESLLDVPHRLNLTTTYVLPFGEGHGRLNRGLAGALLGGWSVTAAGRYQNGFPISVWQSSNNSGLLGSNQRPNLVPGVPLATNGSTTDRLAQWINPAAFTAAPAFTLGNAPRTLPDLRTPGQKNTDLSIQKSQRVGGAVVSLRADVLNLFDNPLFSGPVTTYGTSNFGQITTVNGFARAVQLQVRVGW
jgi:trimeric autotransporter adhesin